jgi:hypothetical protein
MIVSYTVLDAGDISTLEAHGTSDSSIGSLDVIVNVCIDVVRSSWTLLPYLAVLGRIIWWLAHDTQNRAHAPCFR